jgi:FPC/CPF motif-containing protein YcgG
MFTKTDLGISYLGRHEVAGRFAPGSWQQVVFSEFGSALTSEVRPFPCIFGVQGFKDDQLRYLFLEDIDEKILGVQLKAYIDQARQLGQNTSLVVFSSLREIESIQDYHGKFWGILRRLSETDETSWPKEIPEEIANKHWEFCYAGEPIFVVCNTPAHVFRQSRRSSVFMLTFQPRWVFKNILGTPEKALTVFSKVRDRLESFDAIAVSPDLGQYGMEHVLESSQYFLNDKNETITCPFHSLAKKPK